MTARHGRYSAMPPLTDLYRNEFKALKRKIESNCCKPTTRLEAREMEKHFDIKIITVYSQRNELNELSAAAAGAHKGIFCSSRSPSASSLGPQPQLINL